MSINYFRLSQNDDNTLKSGHSLKKFQMFRMLLKVIRESDRVGGGSFDNAKTPK